VIFNNIRHELGARIMPLETKYANGFCDFDEHEVDEVCTVHANAAWGWRTRRMTSRT
jgi:hypothetical protein